MVPLILPIVSNAKCRTCLFLLLGVLCVILLRNLHLIVLHIVPLLHSFGTSSWMLLVGRSLIPTILRISLIFSWWVTLSWGAKGLGWLLFVSSSRLYGPNAINNYFRTLVVMPPPRTHLSLVFSSANATWAAPTLQNEVPECPNLRINLNLT